MHSSFPKHVAILLAAIAALALGALAVGCGDDDDDDTAAPEETVESEAQPDEESEEAPPEEPTATGAELGEMVFNEEACGNCHSIGQGAGAGHGSGPALGGLYNANVKLTDGSTVKADEKYLTRAITQPDAEIVQGFSEGAMAAAIPPGSIPKNEVAALVEYIKQLGG
jgi:mono/diheme cytochrome c family protein